MSVTQTPFAPSLDEHTAPPEPGNASRIQYNVAIGYLRAFVTVLVLARFPSDDRLASDSTA